MGIAADEIPGTSRVDIYLTATPPSLLQLTKNRHKLQPTPTYNLSISDDSDYSDNLLQLRNIEYKNLTYKIVDIQQQIIQLSNINMANAKTVSDGYRADVVDNVSAQGNKAATKIPVLSNV